MHIKLIASLAAVLGGATLTLSGVTPAAATSSLLPVNCETDNVVLDEDGATYELYGTCGVVTVTGDDITVTDLPATRKLVVTGARDHISGKPVDRIMLRGHDSRLSVRSSRIVKISSPGSTLKVVGLLEKCVIAGNASRVHADKLTEVRVEGNRNVVRSERGATLVHDLGQHNTIRVHARA